MKPAPSMPLSSALHDLLYQVTGAHRVIAVEPIQGLWSGYGQLVRCVVDGGTPASVIVKNVRWPTDRDHPRGWNSDLSHRRKVRSYQVETSWYQDYGSRCRAACRVPECLAVRSLGDEVLIVLEDLDVAGFSGRRASATDVELHACLSWLAHFHATFLGSPTKGLWEIGTYWHLDTRPEELAALADGPLKRSAAEIDRRLNASPFCTIVHGDAKLANFCFSTDGRRVAAVDFQYVGGGCGMKDVAYFLGSCLDETEVEDREEELLDFYFARLDEALATAGTDIDFAGLHSDWRALYPLAWTDFYRFLKGWSPGHWKIHRYSERLARQVLAEL